MKKIFIILISAIVILALIVLANFIMQRTTGDKAAELIDRAMTDQYIDYEYKRSYLNPLTKTLYVEELLIDDELFVDYVKISGIKEGDKEITFSAYLRGIDHAQSRNDYVRIESLKLNDLTLTLSDYDEWVPYSIDKINMKNFKYHNYGSTISIGSADSRFKLRIPRSLEDYGTAILENLDYNIVIEDTLWTTDGMPPIDIDSFDLGGSTDSEGNYRKSLFIKAEFFDFGASIGGKVADSINGLSMTDFSFSYTDEGFMDSIIAAMDKISGEAHWRENMLGSLEYADFDEIMDGDKLKALLVDFINNPKNIIIEGNAKDGKSVYLYELMADNMEVLDKIDIALKVNATSMETLRPFLVKRNPDYLDPYAEPANTLGGLVVDFDSVKAGTCVFISHKEDGDHKRKFGCSRDIVKFAEDAIMSQELANERGPFYIEYNRNSRITFIDFAEGYEDWGGEAEEYLEHDDNVAGGLFLNFIKADYDSNYGRYLCSFISQTNSSEHILYCNESDVEYFEEATGTLYVQFDYDDFVTGYSKDWEYYEEWYAKDY